MIGRRTASTANLPRRAKWLYQTAVTSDRLLPHLLFNTTGPAIARRSSIENKISACVGGQFRAVVSEKHC
jgi:hypothetical protein